MNTEEAIDVVIDREGRVFEDDHELMEAAEVLAAEVAKLRQLLRMKK